MHVIISEEALEDLRDIWNFVSRSSVNSADTLIDRLVDHALRLDETHRLFPVVWWLEDRQVCRVNFRTGAIFYRVLPTHVDVMRIVHGGMRMETLFAR